MSTSVLPGERPDRLEEECAVFGVFAPARAGALLLVLAAAYLGGPAAGAAAGVAFGAAMDLNIGYGALFTCCYGL